MITEKRSDTKTNHPTDMTEQNTWALPKKVTLTGKISQQKGAVAYSLVMVILASTLTVAVAVLASDAVFSVVQPFLFLIVGSLHLRRLRWDLHNLTGAEKWLYTLFMAATILVLLGCSWFWGVYFSAVTLLAGPCAFLVPFVLAELWQVYAEISYGEAKVWKLTSELDNEYPAIYITGVPIRFKVMDTEAEASFGLIETRALPRMKLAEAFCDTVQKQNKKAEQPIHLVDAAQKPTRWVFYTNDMVVWKRSLDPELSIIKNKLKRNAVIYVQRLPEVAPLMETENRN